MSATVLRVSGPCFVFGKASLFELVLCSFAFELLIVSHDLR